MIQESKRMQITVKLYFEDEVRRVSIGDENAELMFAHLKSAVDAIFPALHRGTFRVMWKDDDEDLITISSNPEFLDAVKFMTRAGNGAIAKFHVKPIPMETTKPATSATFVAAMDAAAASTPAPAVAPAMPAAVHYGVQCDECKLKPIVGTRYKCTGRYNYDLCAGCEARGPQPYPMMKMEVPAGGPWDALAHHFLPGFGGGRTGGRGGGWGGRGLFGGRGGCPAGRGGFGAPHHGFPHHGFPHHGPADPDDQGQVPEHQDPHAHAAWPGPYHPAAGRGCPGGPWRAAMARKMSRDSHHSTVPAPAAGTSERAVHEGVSCNECGILPIVGTRYKCAARENYDLCGACEARSAQASTAPGAAPLYPMLKIERPEDAPGTFIYMFNKRAAVLGGCHGFRRRNLDGNTHGVGAVMHRHVSCNGCGDNPIFGPRFKCAVRDDYDLCSKCEAAHPQPYPMVKIFLPQHRPSSIVYAAALPSAGPAVVPVPEPARGAVPVAQVQSQVHSTVGCDQCGVTPIVGTRYKCTGRDNYDLCAACEAAASNQPYPMLKVTDPLQAPVDFTYEVRHGKPAPSLSPLQGNQVHYGVRCDECGKNPIQGVRYKCAIRNDFDLCAACEAARPQPYPVVKIYDPAHHPTQLVYVLPAPLPVPAPVPTPVSATAPVPAVPSPAAPQVVVPVPAPAPNVAHVPTVAPAVAALPKPSLRFVRDRTLPDGSTVQAGQLGLVKIWDVRNDGPHAWPAGSVLTFAGGDVLHAGPSVGVTVGGPVAPLRAGEEGQLSVNLSAPRQAGRYVGYYRMQTAEGQNFGQRLWADIVVVPCEATGLSAEETAAQEDADRQLAEEIHALMLEAEVDSLLAAQEHHHEEYPLEQQPATESVKSVEVTPVPADTVCDATATTAVVTDGNNKNKELSECEWDMVGRCVTVLGEVLEVVPEDNDGELSDAESEYSSGVHQPMALSTSQQGATVPAPDAEAASYDHVCGDLDFDDTDNDSALYTATATAAIAASVEADAKLAMSTSFSGGAATESKEGDEQQEVQPRGPSPASPVRSAALPMEAPAVEVPTVSAVQDEAQVWHKELQMLREMGFLDTAAIIPVLQRHLGAPASADADAAVVTHAFHAVLTDLLSSA